MPTGNTDHSPSRGDAEIFDLRTMGATARSAARRYASSPIEELRQAVRLDWDAMDEWLEEDEPVYTHPRDPYTRVDILASSRHVRIDIDGVTVADSSQPRSPVRDRPSAAVLPPARPTCAAGPAPRPRPPPSATAPTRARPATGRPRTTGTAVRQDLVWIYRSRRCSESQKIAGLACFYNEKADFYLEGALQQRPHTKFS